MARSSRGGDCYAACGRVILLDGDRNMRVCHGEVFNAKSGRFHGHGWLETTEPVFGTVLCRDIANERDMTLPRDAYYRLGRVRKVRRFTGEEARLLLAQTGRWGPWQKVSAVKMKKG